MKKFRIRGSRFKAPGWRLSRAGSEKGAALLTAIVILLALTIMGFALVLVTKVDLSVSRNLRMAEEALHAGEIGASMCGLVAVAENKEGMDYGDTAALNLSEVEGNRYPNWSCLVAKEGQAPSRGGSSLEQTESEFGYFQFRIQSKGIGRAQAQRTVETLIRIRQVMYGGKGGYSRVAYRYL